MDVHTFRRVNQGPLKLQNSLVKYFQGTKTLLCDSYTIEH